MSTNELASITDALLEAKPANVASFPAAAQEAMILAQTSSTRRVAQVTALIPRPNDLSMVRLRTDLADAAAHGMLSGANRASLAHLQDLLAIATGVYDRRAAPKPAASDLQIVRQLERDMVIAARRAHLGLQDPGDMRAACTGMARLAALEEYARQPEPKTRVVYGNAARWVDLFNAYMKSRVPESFVTSSLREGYIEEHPAVPFRQTRPA